VKLQEVSTQILTKQSDRASPNSVILTATIVMLWEEPPKGPMLRWTQLIARCLRGCQWWSRFGKGLSLQCHADLFEWLASFPAWIWVPDLRGEIP
jgi:hypothetical protein